MGAINTQTPAPTAAPHFYALTEGDGRQLKSDIFARPWDLAAGLATGTPVEQSLPIEERSDRALEARTRVRGLLQFATWPLQIYEIEGAPLEEHRWDNKLFDSVAVVRRLQATKLFGPGGEHVAALLDRYVALHDAKDNRQLLEALAESWQGADPGQENASTGTSSGAVKELAVPVASASAVAYRTAHACLGSPDLSWLDRPAQQAARDAVVALSARHLIGTEQFTRLTTTCSPAPCAPCSGPSTPATRTLQTRPLS